MSESADQRAAIAIEAMDDSAEAAMRLVQLAKVFERFIDPAYTVVHGFYGSCISADKIGEFEHTFSTGIGEIFAKTEYWAVDAVPGIEPFADPFGLARQVKGGPWITDLDVIVDIFVFLLRRKGGVRRFVSYH